MGGRADPGPAIVAAGGALMCLAPLLPWVRLTVPGVARPSVLHIAAGSVTGVHSVSGLLCVLAGATASLCLVVLMQRGRASAGLATAIAVAGVVGALGVTFAAVAPRAVVRTDGFDAQATIWVFAAIVGGLLVVAGGIVLRRRHP